MLTAIPLHAVVLDLLSPDPLRFPAHEILDPVQVARSLGGDAVHLDHPAAMAELVRRAEAKVRLGERAVIPGHGLHRATRAALANTARNHGVPGIWLLPPTCSDRELMNGDGGAEVVVTDAVRVVKPSSDLAAMFAGRRGITVVGDIHGMHQSMLAATGWANSRNHGLVLLGDVIDYGHATLQCADEAWRMVTRGDAAMVLGNHERKIGRYLALDPNDRKKMKLSPGNKATDLALSHLTHHQRQAWAGRFRGLLWRCRPILRLGTIVMTHAAVHPRYWQGYEDGPVEEYALFGEPDPKVKPPRFATSYKWVDHIPKDHTVIVGHDIRSMTTPVTVTGAKGGVAIFLDTGCGKGGRLSSADLRFGENGRVRVENLNVH